MDYLSHLVARINSGIKAGDTVVVVPKSKFNILVLRFLERSGYILSFTVGDRTVNVVLNYYKGRSTLTSLKRISKPGRRVYITNKQMSNFYRQDKNYIVLNSLDKDLFWLWQINMLNQGGEIILEIK